MPDPEIYATGRPEPLTRLAFSIYGSPGVYALLVGSGLSRAAGVLTGWEITLDLIRRIAVSEGESEQPDWEAWYRARFGREPAYSELVAQLGGSPQERRAILHSYIEPSPEDLLAGHRVPTKAHRAIADLVYDGFVRVILTTNFDRLLETALRERGTEPSVVDSVHALEGAEPLTHTRCYLVKLHGDYKDARILNTDDELAHYPHQFDVLLDRILDEHGLVVCGWSGEWDHALRNAIMRSRSRRYSLFWAARGRLGDDPRRIVTHRAGQVVPIADADDFLGALRDKVHGLAQTHRQEPRTVDLLVSSTKRFASRPEHRIELHDLLESELQQLLRQLSAPPEADADPDGVRHLVAFCDSVTEPLGRMFGVLGRWGDGAERDHVANTVLTLWTHSDMPARRLVHLRRYPAVLLLWAYGTGLTLAKRWRTLYDLLSYPFDSDNHERRNRLVDMAGQWFLEGNRNDLWTRLPGLENHRTPAWEHLFSVMEAQRDSFAAVLADFEGLHDTWEVLFSMTYSEGRVSEQTEKGGRPPWIPVGRNGWRERPRQRILDRVADGDLHRELLAAGFCAGREELLTAAVDSYSDFVARLGWRY